MRALVYNGPRDVSVQEVPDARIESPTDAVVRVTTTNICGSDLHMYEGRTSVETGKVLGHENMGVVAEVGAGVHDVKVGDRVSLPFNIACGHCRNCNRRKTAFCTEVNPGGAGGAYGYADMGPYSGGQAEYLRVPFADFNALVLPEGDEHELDYAMLSDIFPTGWHGTRLSGLEPGESVVVMGAGPVGLMAALSARVQGASQVFVVDQQADRLVLAEELGATAVDFSAGSAVDQVMQATGGVGVVGVFPPADPDGPDELMQQGRLRFPFGSFTKGLTMGTGQADVKTYNRRLRDLITAGRVSPGRIVSQEMDLDRAAEGYRRFDAREDGWTKVVLHP